MESQFSSEVEILPENFPSYDLSFKIIVIGNSGVGKSCLSIQATKGKFVRSNKSTIGFEFVVMNIKYKDKIIKLQIWDTCGQEVYRALITSFFRDSSLAVIVYAVDDQKSFNSVEDWLKQLKNQSSPDCKVFLIGNKIDLEDQRVVETRQGETLKKNLGINMFMETSAKTGINAKELFIEAARLLCDEYLKVMKTTKNTINQDVIQMLNQDIKESLEKENSEKKKCCK